MAGHARPTHAFHTRRAGPCAVRTHLAPPEPRVGVHQGETSRIHWRTSRMRQITRTPLRVRGAFALVLLAACGDGTAPEPAVGLPGNNALVFRDAGELDPVRDLIRSLMDSTVRLVRAELPVTGVGVLVSADRRGAIPEIGLGGNAPEADVVYIDIDMTVVGIADSLRRHLPLIVAHELHHTMRHRSGDGYGATLARAIVSEGLADRFAVEITGHEPPPWSVALSDSVAAAWLGAAQAVWHEPGYDHDLWFFGAGGSVPRWTGYTLGWRLVSAYQAQHPGVRAADLWDAPAADFLP